MYKLSEKTKTKLKWFAFLIASGWFILSLIAIIVMAFKGGYGFWKWFEATANLIFFGFTSWYFYFKQIKK